MMKTGSVSTGTLRRHDLIPAFIEVLREVAPDAYVQLMVAPFPPIPSYVHDDGNSSPWWDSEDAEWLLESLFDELDWQADEGYYFGAHPGDAADFGFWKFEA